MDRNIEPRLADLVRMRDNWDAEDGEPPTDAAIDAARAVINIMLQEDLLLQRPCLYPDDNGGVVAEWSFEAHASDMTFYRDGMTVVLGKTVFDSTPIAAITLKVDELLGNWTLKALPC